ncbi:hypothetical protein SASPL_140699 [Salvia splendens]|uniref:Uncharacterized protein n=1 Tax=Salvia splendens TaxID=180675 RepID=A0A8X8ZC63_SALSN|nr:hypothetical protein SASPL_140699 [Salvia splendens]
MAASSPAKSNSGGTDVSAPPSSKSLRGLNKPKCIKCGNVARSRFHFLMHHCVVPRAPRSCTSFCFCGG